MLNGAIAAPSRYRTLDQAVKDRFLPRLPGWKRRGRMLVSPVEHDMVKVIELVEASGSGDKIGIHVWALPLFVELRRGKEEIPFHVRQEVPGSWRWADPAALEKAVKAMEKHALTYLAEVATPAAYAADYEAEVLPREWVDRFPDPWEYESVAHCWVMAGKPAKARKILARAPKYLDKHGDKRDRPEMALKKRLSGIDTLNQRDPEAARKRLTDIATRVRKRLKLP